MQRSLALLALAGSASATMISVDRFGVYPGYTGALKPTGRVGLNFEGTAVDIGYLLEGVDSACSAPKAGVANSCGIHIHAGKTCDDASVVGGHYFNNATVKADPWVTAATYKSVGTNAVGALRVSYGYDFASTLGRAFVLHDSNGVRISCTLIFPRPQIADLTFDTYPGYTGPLSPSGAADLSFVDNQVQIEFTLYGVDPACTAPKAGTANSCGIHIHEGTTCDDATKVGGHFFNATTVKADPWVTAAFYTTYDNTANSVGVVAVNNGETFEATVGRAFVLHDSNGVRISCGLITESKRYL